MRSRSIVLICASALSLSVFAGCSGATAAVPNRSVDELIKEVQKATDPQAGIQSARIIDAKEAKNDKGETVTERIVIEGMMDGSNMLIEKNTSNGCSMRELLAEDKVFYKATDKCYAQDEQSRAKAEKYADKWVGDDPNTTADAAKETTPSRALSGAIGALNKDSFQKVEITNQDGQKIYRMTNDKGSVVDVDPTTMLPLHMKFAEYPDDFKFENWNDAAKQTPLPDDQYMKYEG